MSLQHLLGPVKAKGIYDPKVQMFLQRHCEAGRIAEVADVVAQYFFDDGIVKGYIPPAAGKKTKDLMDRVGDSAKKIAEEYARRGVLCAKGFYPPQMLMLLIIRNWEKAFYTAAKSEEHGLALLDENVSSETNARATVAAQAIAKLLLARLEKIVREDDEALVLPMNDLEGLCTSAVREMYSAFTKPDAYIHEMLHGVKPTEDE